MELMRSREKQTDSSNYLISQIQELKFLKKPILAEPGVNQ